MCEEEDDSSASSEEGEALIRRACAQQLSPNCLIWATAPWIRGPTA
jgi:hypothetical protein